MVAAIFWVSALCLAHTFLLYPLLLVAMDAWTRAVSDFRYLSGAGDRRVGGGGLGLPKVTLAVAAWNEAGVIRKKVENSLGLDYPSERIQILVGSDGSDDGTDEIVREVDDPRVLLSTGRRTGKVGVLNRIVPMASGEIVVFSDANTVFDPAAVRMLVRHFQDPEVGLVCGRLRLYNPSNPGFEESQYWLYESFLKFHEGKRGAVMGANGGIYAMRKNLFRRLPPDTVVDDFVMAGQCLLAGRRVIYDPEAVAWEETTEDYKKERSRRARIAAGNFHALAHLRGLLHPSRGFVAFAFASHKLLRWMAPFFLLSLLASNLLLLDRRSYLLTLGAQLAFYTLALAGILGVRKGRVGRLASLARYFTEMNWGMLEGFFRWLRGTQKVTWERTARNAPPAA